MNKLAKKIIRILPIVMIICVMAVNVWAAGTNINVPNAPSGSGSTKIKNAVGSVWATAITIIQILAVGAVVFAGVKYMISPADKRAEIKQGLGTLAVGAALVFASTTLIKFVVGSVNQVLK